MHTLLAAAALLGTSAAFAQPHAGGSTHSGYAGLQQREIKALSPEQVADLQQGRGMGASLPAELNGVPGPLHVLELAEHLAVTPVQRRVLEEITATMTASARPLGQQVVAEERRLDQAFSTGRADEDLVRESTARIGALQGRLRAVHLLAHLKTRQLLSAEQVAAYNQARGYATGASGQKHRH